MKTMQIERMGVNPKWEKRWKKTLRNMNDPRWSEINADTAHNFSEYASTGIIPEEVKARQTYEPSTEVFDPPFFPWETVYLSMEGYANMRTYEFEKQSIATGWSAELAMQSFTASYISVYKEHYKRYLFGIRFNGRILTISLKDTPFTALGMIIGCKEEASKLARMQLVAHRKGFYYKDKYPIYNFVLRIMADYLNESPLELTGESLTEPIFNALFDHWRASDLDSLSSICLAACDFHTHRCKPDVRNEWYEFNNGEWHKFPFEILLVFKLRQLLGLKNPVIDHPLMNTPLGVLPTQDATFAPDELITRVRARMVQDGFDEQLIYKRCSRLNLQLV